MDLEVKEGGRGFTRFCDQVDNLDIMWEKYFMQIPNGKVING